MDIMSYRETREASRVVAFLAARRWPGSRITGLPGLDHWPTCVFDIKATVFGYYKYTALKGIFLYIQPEKRDVSCFLLL